MRRKLLLLLTAVFLIPWIGNAQITTFPYSEDFESTFLPNGWLKELGDAANDITQNDAQNHTGGGTYSCRFSSYSSASNYNQYLFTDTIHVDATHTQLTFWHRKHNTSSETLEWGISTTTQSSSAVSSWTAVSLSNTDWQETTVDLSAYSGTTIFFAWHYYGDYLYYVYLDDVAIDAPPSCPDPTAQTETNITSSGADLGWTDASGSHWDVYVVPTGDPAPVQGTTPTADDITTNPYTWSGGSANTTYDWYVRSDCDQNNAGTSAWVGPSTFTTACSTKTAPWSDDFEAHTATTNSTWDECWSSDPTGTTSAFRWDLDDSGSTPSGSTGPDAAHSGSKYGYTEASSGSTGDLAYLYSPYIDVSGLTSAELTFYYHMYGAAMGNLHVDVYDGSSWTNDVFSLSGQQQTSGSDLWLKATVNLSAYSGTIRIRFRGERGNGYTGDMSIDDFDIHETPTCPDPSAQTEDSLRLDGAQLSWTENGSAGNWDVRIGVTGYDTTGTSYASVTNDTITVDTLLASTTYDWYVRASCGGGDFSEWIGPHSFTTTSGKAMNPYPADGADPVLVSSDTLKWNPVDHATKYLLSIGTTSGGDDVLSNHSLTDTIYVPGNPWDYATQYFWTVSTVYNGTNDTVAGTEWDFTTECGIYTPEYSQDFSSYLPICWSETTGYLANPSVLTGTSSSWMQDDFANVSGNGKSAKLNIWGTSRKEWLISPSIDLSGDSYQLEFDLALTHYGNTNSDTLGPDDTLAVVISTDNGATWNLNDTLEVWTYPEFISNTGEHITIDLSSYNTTVQIGFYGSSSVSNEDNDIFVDNFKVRVPPACPDPTAQTESNITPIGADLGWTDASGSHWDIYVVPTGDPAPAQDTTPTANDVTVNPYTWSGGSANTTYDWYVRSDCDQDNTGTSTWIGPSTFTTECNAVTSLPYTESFETAVPPDCWTEEIVNDPGTDPDWSYVSSGSSPNVSPVDGSNMAKFNSFSCPSGAEARLYTPQLDLSGITGTAMSFWMYHDDGYSTKTGEGIKVQVSTDGTTWTDIGSLHGRISSNNGWSKHTVDLSAYDGQTIYIGFLGVSDYGNNMYLDGVTIHNNAPAAATWTGSSDNNWYTDANWNTSDIPYPTTEVTIPGSGITNFPTISTPGAECHNLTIQSTSSGDGSLIGAEYLSLSGNSTVQRYIPAWSDAFHGWHNISSPVASQNISTEFVDISATPISNTVDFYRWSEPDSIWVNIKDVSGNYNQGSAATNFSNDANPTFEPGKGYLIAYGTDQTKSFTGTLNTDDINITGLSYTSSTQGWHLLGNPYQSALYWNNTSWGLTNIDGTAKVWDETAASYSDIVSATGIIPAMQGFMVHVNASTGSLTIKAADRTHSTTSWYKDVPANTLKLTAIDVDGNTAQVCNIRVIEDATQGFDEQYDAHFLKGYAPQFYAVEGNNKLSTDALPSLSSNSSIPLSFIKNGATHFMIKAEGIDNMVPEVNTYLKDLKTNYTQLLNNNPVYEFTSSEDDDPQRFELLFSPVGINEIPVGNINIFSVNKRVEIRANSNINAVVIIYNVTGQVLAKVSMKNQQSTSIDLGSFTGLAVVSVIESKSSTTSKVILR